MREDAFKEWYSTYNPAMDPDLDDMYEELRDCFYHAWDTARSDAFAALKETTHETT